MKSIAGLFLLALFLSSLYLPLVRKLFLRLGKLDYPDARKQHVTPVPRCGGIAIILAYLSAVGVLGLVSAGANQIFERYAEFLVRLVPATVAIFLTGALDDWINLRPATKLSGQVAAAGIACWAGLRVVDPMLVGDWLSFGLTCFWLVLCANAFNLIDGTDGLAGTLGILSSLGLIVVALSLDYYPLALVFAPLLGAILPFLRRNWPPASVFMGDAGSLTIGFLLGCGGAALARRLPDGSGICAAILLLVLPIGELGFSSLRRLLRGQSIFEADALHFHHQLKRQGLGAGAVLATLGVAGFLGTALAVLQLRFNPMARLVAISVFLAALGWGLARLRYPEFIVLTEALVGGRFRTWLRQQIELRILEEELRHAPDGVSVWLALNRVGTRLGLTELRVCLLGRRWEQPEMELEPEISWRVRLDLPLRSWVNFRVPATLHPRDNPSGDFAAVITKALSERRLLELGQGPGMEPYREEAYVLDRSG